MSCFNCLISSSEDYSSLDWLGCLDSSYINFIILYHIFYVLLETFSVPFQMTCLLLSSNLLLQELQELLVTWKPYMELASCIFVYAPAKNRQMLFDPEKPHSSLPSRPVRHIPLTVHRPTLKEAKRVYNHLTHVAYEEEAKPSMEEVLPSCAGEEGNNNERPIENQSGEKLVINESLSGSKSVGECLPSEAENVVLPTCEYETTPLHEAAKSGDAQCTLDLLEQGLNPCIKDTRGRTPYMLATEKEVRNTFRRYMAANLDKWDWHAANVPSALTKEMEESQAAKQVIYIVSYA